MNPNDFILGEFRRTFDDRHRLTVPNELLAALGEDETEFILAKERPGCISLWNVGAWQARFDVGMDLVKAKLRAGRLEGQWSRLQALGRLLSTRHTTVRLTGRGRFIVPEGFREFLKVDAGQDAMLVGAAVCVEVWQPQAWRECLESQMPEFRNLFDQLSL